MDADLEFAFALADQAASISLPAFNDPRLAAESKADGSPVTAVDSQVETALRSRIREQRPDHMILGEEDGTSGRSEWCWYLDPIDGTHRYINGDPHWMTLIALAHRQEILVGIVDLPALKQRWWAAKGGEAFCDGRPITVSTNSYLNAAVINDDRRGHIANGDRQHPLATIADHCARVRPHQGHSALAVASGLADIAISTGSHPWDYAAVKIIVEEAGGTYSDFAGEPRIDTGQAVATNGRLHAQVLALLAPPSSYQSRAR